MREVTFPLAASGPLSDSHGDTSSFSVMLDHAVDQAVLDRLVGLKEAISFHIGVHLFYGLARVVCVDLIDPLSDAENLPSMDFDVRRLSLEAGRWLVDEDPAVGEGEALTLGARAQQQ